MTITPEQSKSLRDPCVGACCTDSRLVLDFEEADHIRAGGTNLAIVLGEYMLRDIETGQVSDYRLEALKQLYDDCPDDDPIRETIIDLALTLVGLKQDQEYYEIRGRCGYLDADNRCTTYDDRPKICRDFPPGGVACLRFRGRHGLDIGDTTVMLPDPVRKSAKASTSVS